MLYANGCNGGRTRVGLFGSKTDFSTTPKMRAAPDLVREIEGLRQLTVEWANTSIDAPQSGKLEDRQREAPLAGRVLERTGTVVDAWNGWHVLPRAVGDLQQWSRTPESLVSLGTKAMLALVRAQQVVMAYVLVDVENGKYPGLEEAAMSVNDPEWSRYALHFGPVDEQLQGRFWTPPQVTAYLVEADRTLRRCNPVNEQWSALVDWLLKDQAAHNG